MWRSCTGAPLIANTIVSFEFPFLLIRREERTDSGHAYLVQLFGLWNQTRVGKYIIPVPLLLFNSTVCFC